MGCDWPGIFWHTRERIRATATKYLSSVEILHELKHYLIDPILFSGPSSNLPSLPFLTEIPVRQNISLPRGNMGLLLIFCLYWHPKWLAVIKLISGIQTKATPGFEEKIGAATLQGTMKITRAIAMRTSVASSGGRKTTKEMYDREK